MSQDGRAKVAKIISESINLEAFREKLNLESDKNRQRDLVAKIMARPAIIDDFMSQTFMQDETWWHEPESYYAFMLMLYLRGAGKEKTWSKEMVARGKELLK